MSYGIDIYYKNQTVTDAVALRNDGVEFAFCKCGDGRTGIVDVSKSLAQAKQLQNGGIKVGAYFYAQPGITNPEEQADRFYNESVSKMNWDLAPALDMEQTTANVNYNDWSRRFITRLRARTNTIRVILYSSKSWFTNGNLNEAMYDENVPLWVARYYQNSADFNTLGWTDAQLSIYQYWDKGSHKGISGALDLDVTQGDLSRITWASNIPIYNKTTKDDEMNYSEYLHPAGPNQNITIPHNGVAGQLVVCPTGSDVKLAATPFMWSANGGVGGGDTSDPTALVAEVNRPGSYRIPAGTLRIFVTLSSDSAFYAYPV